MLASYAQLQEIRTYYKFVDVDNDRYVIDGTYRQVMLSARELSHQHLQSRNWINEHLTFTHGHGVVFGPVNQVTSKEASRSSLSKTSRRSRRTSLKVTRPEIYYGELANEYVLVKTSAQELDYPAGDQNIYTTYEGTRRSQHRFIVAQAGFLGAPRDAENASIAGSKAREPHPFSPADP